MAEVIYVCGVPGSGRFAVHRELRRRGHAAFRTDEDGIAALSDHEGTMVERINALDTAEWRRAHTWKILPNRLDELAASVSGERVFVWGSAANEAEVWHRFEVVISLVADDETIRTRLASREGNNFGKTTGELALALGWNQSFARDAPPWGAVVIDAARPIESVVDDVVAAAGEAG